MPVLVLLDNFSIERNVYQSLIVGPTIQQSLRTTFIYCATKTAENTRLFVSPNRSKKLTGILLSQDGMHRYRRL